MDITITTGTIIKTLSLIIVILIISIMVMYTFPEKECPETKIIEKVVTKNPLDIQFSRENFPSTVHNDLFTQSTPWIGGTPLGIGKTYTFTKQK